MPRPLVLVADAEPLIRWSIGELLRLEGYDAIEAADGRAAIRQCERGVDLVLLDAELPDVGGSPVLSRVRAIDPAVPIILMAPNGARRELAALQLPSFPHAGMPFRLADLVAMVGCTLAGADPQRSPKDLRCS